MSELAPAAAGYTVNDLFQRAFRIFADRTAVTSETAHYTYRELGKEAAQLASGLYGLGVRHGDRVAVLSETRPEYVTTYAALASLGATALTLNIRLHPDELAYCIDAGRPVAIIHSGRLAHLIEGIRVPRLNFDDGYRDLLSDATPPPVTIRAGDIHNVLYTSGTTGRPKGAMISHGAAAIRGLRLAQWFGLTEEDGFVGWLPLFHCGGDESLYATMLTGGTFCALAKADAPTMCRVIERDRLTWTLLLPGVITDFLHTPARTGHDLSSLRFAIGYANMMPNVVTELTTTFGIDFYDAFGQTESSYLLAHGVSGPGEAPTLRKTPSPLLDVRLVDDAMNEAEVGECVVRGPSVMSGYLDDPAATEEAFRGGWLHTGDLLRRNEDGTLSFVDRKKYLIKTGGENVYPAEVEQAIAAHDDVQEACVFGVPDERWGETVKAVVVRRPGATLSAQDVVAWCRDRLAGYKRPRYVQFLTADQLPRSTTGKLQRHELAKIPVHADQLV